jgi:hypothetical protein
MLQKTVIAALMFVLRFDWFGLCCTLLAGVTRLPTSSGTRSVRGRMLRLFFYVLFSVWLVFLFRLTSL